jgi:predicted RNase H-like nuclease (RuvC/YqgF family)
MTEKEATNEPIIHDWTEYKRLVLSELERLNKAVEKLKDQCVETQNLLHSEISKVRESLSLKMNDLDKNHPTKTEVEKFKRELDELDAKLLAYKEEQQVDASAAHKWGFWAAVISIAGSLIVSIISMIIALSGNKP